MYTHSTELIIAVGHRSISGQLLRASARFLYMRTKWPTEEIELLALATARPQPRKRRRSVKWACQRAKSGSVNSIASTSLLWLRCDKDEANRSLVATLYCKVCRQFEDRIRGMRNFSSAWVTGTTNHRTSNVLDHAKSDQHIASMSRLREERAKAQNAPISSYAPILVAQ